MDYKITATVTLENEHGVMCTQTTEWRGMDHAQMVGLEMSYLDWMASLPRTIGAEGSEPTKK